MRSLKIMLLCCTALGGASAFAANLTIDEAGAPGALRPVAAGAGAPAPVVDPSKYQKVLLALKGSKDALQKVNATLKQVNVEKTTFQSALDAARGEADALRGALEAARAETDKIRAEAARANEEQLAGILSKEAALEASHAAAAAAATAHAKEKTALEAEIKDLAGANDEYVEMEADIKAALLVIVGMSEAENIDAAVAMVKDLVGGQEETIFSVKASLLEIAGKSEADVEEGSIDTAVDLVRRLFKEQVSRRTMAESCRFMAEEKCQEVNKIRLALREEVIALRAELSAEREKVRNAFFSGGSGASAGAGGGARRYPTPDAETAKGSTSYSRPSSYSRSAYNSKPAYTWGGAGAGAGRDSVDKEKVYRQKVKEAFALLGVSSKDSEETIKDAFHKLARKQHPDKDKSAEATAKMQELSAARDLVLEFREMYGR